MRKLNNLDSILSQDLITIQISTILTEYAHSIETRPLTQLSTQEKIALKSKLEVVRDILKLIVENQFVNKELSFLYHAFLEGDPEGLRVRAGVNDESNKEEFIEFFITKYINNKDIELNDFNVE